MDGGGKYETDPNEHNLVDAVVSSAWIFFSFINDCSVCTESVWGMHVQETKAGTPTLSLILCHPVG